AGRGRTQDRDRPGTPDAPSGRGPAPSGAEPIHGLTGCPYGPAIFPCCARSRKERLSGTGKLYSPISTGASATPPASTACPACVLRTAPCRCPLPEGQGLRFLPCRTGPGTVRRSGQKLRVGARPAGQGAPRDGSPRVWGLQVVQ